MAEKESKGLFCFKRKMMIMRMNMIMMMKNLMMVTMK